MKLVGSKTESEYREQLIRSHNSLFRDSNKQRLLLALRQFYPKMKAGYTLHWIPEQGEDIYHILIASNLLVEVEVDRFNKESEPIIKEISLDQYKQRLSKTEQIKLAVAIELLKEKGAGRTPSPAINLAG